MPGVILAARGGTAGVRQVAGQAAPAVDLDQQVGQVDDGQLV